MSWFYVISIIVYVTIYHIYVIYLIDCDGLWFMWYVCYFDIYIYIYIYVSLYIYINDTCHIHMLYCDMIGIQSECSNRPRHCIYKKQHTNNNNNNNNNNNDNNNNNNDNNNKNNNNTNNTKNWPCTKHKMQCVTTANTKQTKNVSASQPIYRHTNHTKRLGQAQRQHAWGVCFWVRKTIACIAIHIYIYYIYNIMRQPYIYTCMLLLLLYRYWLFYAHWLLGAKRLLAGLFTALMASSKSKSTGTITGKLRQWLKCWRAELSPMAGKADQPPPL